MPQIGFSSSSAIICCLPSHPLPFNPCLSCAFTVAIDTSALIAEVFATSTRHTITTIYTIYPPSAMRAFLNFFCSDKLKESRVVFLAALSWMVTFSASYTILLFACRAINSYVTFLENKGIGTVWSGTPSDIFLGINCHLKSSLVEQLHIFG